MRIIVSGSLTAVLGACAVATPAQHAPPPSLPETMPGGLCNASNAQFLLGKTIDERLAQDARERTGARVVRVLRPGQMITKEYLTSRLNIEVDDAGQALRAYCG